MEAGKVVGVDLRHHPPSVLKVAILPFKVRLVDPVVLWWKTLQEYVLVPAVRRALLGCDRIQVVAARSFLSRKSSGSSSDAFSPFLIPGAPLARSRASSQRTYRVELAMRPVHALLGPLVFFLQTFARQRKLGRMSYKRGCRTNYDLHHPNSRERSPDRCPIQMAAATLYDFKDWFAVERQADA